MWVMTMVEEGDEKHDVNDDEEEKAKEDDDTKH